MKDFVYKRLSDCCTINPPRSEAKEVLSGNDLVSFVPMNHLKIGSKFFHSNEKKILSEVIKNYTYFADDDILLAKITPCFENGKLGIARDLSNRIGFGSSEFIIFRAKHYLMPEYLYYFLMSPEFRERGKKVMTGAAGHKRVPKSYIENTIVPITPIQEQKRIVAILDQTFADIEKIRANTEKNLKNSRELFESYLQQVFSQRGEGWKTNVLKNICEKITDGTHQTPKYFDSGYIFLSSKNVTSGAIDWGNVRYIDHEQHKALHKRLAPRLNDILLAKNGTTGVGAIVDKEVVFDIYVSLALIRSKGEVLPKFLLYFINSPIAKKQFNKRLKGIGVPNLHLNEIREVIIYYPKSKQAQLDTIFLLDKFNTETRELEQIYVQKLLELDHLKKSLLHQAFTGQLTKQEVAV